MFTKNLRSIKTLNLVLLSLSFLVSSQLLIASPEFPHDIVELKQRAGDASIKLQCWNFELLEKSTGQQLHHPFSEKPLVCCLEFEANKSSVANVYFGGLIGAKIADFWTYSNATEIKATVSEKKREFDSRATLNLTAIFRLGKGGGLAEPPMVSGNVLRVMDTYHPNETIVEFVGRLLPD